MANILVIDDDASFREYLTALLGREGYEVRCLASGVAVGDVVRTGRFDAVVTDLYMPHVDGIETLLSVKQVAPAMPVIGLSAGFWSPSDPCHRAMTLLGAEAVLSKPLDGAAFLAILRRAIERVAPAGGSI